MLLLVGVSPFRLTPVLGFPYLVALLDVELLVMTMFFVLQGRKAKDIINAARASLAKMIGGKPQDIIFTSGGTEVKLLPLPKGNDGVGVGSHQEQLLAVDHRLLQPQQFLD